MDSKAFYLKYRPQKISELDLVDVSQALEKVLKSGRVPHALLFVGPRGTGKTSAARIVAKAINCKKKAGRQNGKKKAVKLDFEPCNRCQICREITAGTFLDLIEIDAASNRGIDDIRNLREKIKLSPAQAQYKVYIIDEVHMLTTEAFNALLKTIEEPPAHAVFILCTTAPEKLPQTIISRCLRFNFRKAEPGEIIKGPLKKAVKGEKLRPEKGVLEEIAKSVDGSFRDAHKILEQLAFAGQKISLKETKSLLGKIEALVPEKLLSLLAARDVKSGLLEIDRVVGIGGNLTVYVQEILDRLRQGMLAKVGLKEVSLPKGVEAFSLGEVRMLIQLFSRAVNEMRTNPIPQLPLELVVVEWGEGGEEHSATNFSLMSARKNKRIPPDGGTSAQIRSKLSPRVPSPSPRGDGLEEIKKRWDELLAGVRPLNHSVEALLRAARPAEMDDDFLTLEVFYKFHKERLETEKCRTVVEEIASQILGTPIKLRCILGQKGKTTQDPSGAKTQSDSSDDFNSSAADDIMRTAEEIFEV